MRESPSTSGGQAVPVAAGVCQPKQAIERLGGLTDLYADVLGRFLDDQAGSLAKLRGAVESSNVATAREAAHSLRGLAAMCGAASVSEVSGRIEQAARAEQVAIFPELLAQLDAEMEAASTVLGGYR